MSDRCTSCNSFRIAKLSGKTSDMCCVQMASPADEDDVVEHLGYVPGDMNIGGGDYIEFNFCLECGQIQGEFPTGLTEMELKAGLSENHS